MIKHANIIYMPCISALGGIETYVYELVKKYHKLDIAVVSKQCDASQRERIEKYCKVYIHTNQKIECKVAIINYDTTILDYINPDAKVYQTIHADYTNPIYQSKPQFHPRITSYIAITKYLQDRMKDLLHTDNVMLSYNPLTVDNTDTIILVSATRIHAHKGRDRMQKLANELDKQNINYLWFIISNDINVIKGNNIIFIKNRNDIPKFLSIATYVVLLSDSEACSYTLNEALYRNIPIITTPLPYLKEIGVKDNINSYIVNFDCSNISDVVTKINNVPKFQFKKLNDKYNNLLARDKSHYISEYDEKTFVRVRKEIVYYYDMQLCKNIYATDGEFEVTKHRAKELVGAGVCEYVYNEKENEK